MHLNLKGLAPQVLKWGAVLHLGKNLKIPGLDVHNVTLERKLWKKTCMIITAITDVRSQFYCTELDIGGIEHQNYNPCNAYWWLRYQEPVDCTSTIIIVVMVSFTSELFNCPVLCRHASDFTISYN